MDTTLQAILNDIEEDFTADDFNGMDRCWYEVWAIGYDTAGRITDTEILLKSFDDPDKAVEYAKSVDLADIINHPDTARAAVHEVDYLQVEVETVVEDATCCENVGTVYRNVINI